MFSLNLYRSNCVEENRRIKTIDLYFQQKTWYWAFFSLNNGSRWVLIRDAKKTQKRFLSPPKNQFTRAFIDCFQQSCKIRGRVCAFNEFTPMQMDYLNEDNNCDLNAEILFTTKYKSMLLQLLHFMIHKNGFCCFPI